ncbi:conserved hypothetical protein [Lebetimonas natsushimae]|uniref:Uncharacterized protein n=1 Tax=Lebetimonas natsushimae TaxID=1936991 RepID=A0A292YI12_9BACT|nr:hypothetical protein [Lebetimonas natsushimae]GAX88280.1 conserved hypothetical protein [Lebetimonas natsushimae]
MEFIEKSNDLILMLSFVCIVILAETSATFGVFLTAKGHIILGGLFYIFKIIIYIPSVDIFRRNKNRLMKYKIIQFGYFLYEKIEKNPVFISLREKFRIFKEKVVFFIKPYKEQFKKFWEKIWNR